MSAVSRSSRTSEERKRPDYLNILFETRDREVAAAHPRIHCGEAPAHEQQLHQRHGESHHGRAGHNPSATTRETESATPVANS